MTFDDSYVELVMIIRRAKISLYVFITIIPILHLLSLRRQQEPLAPSPTPLYCCNQGPRRFRPRSPTCLASRRGVQKAASKNRPD